MDEVKSSLVEIKEYALDRLKMPIFFYFFVILAVWNWDLILLILKSENTIECIITTIKGNSFEYKRYLCPFLIAVLGNVFFPLVMLGIDYPLNWINKRRNKKSANLELTKAGLEFDIQVAKSGTDKLALLNSQISQLSSEKSDFAATLKTANETIEKLSKDIADKDVSFSNYRESIVSSKDTSLNKEFKEFDGYINYLIRDEERSISNKTIFTCLTKIYYKEKSSSEDDFDIRIFTKLAELGIIESGPGKGIPVLSFKGIKFLYWLGGKSGLML